MTGHRDGSHDLLLDTSTGEFTLSEGDQLLLHSAFINDSEGCKKAFDIGANPNASQEDRITAVHIAAEKGYYEFAASLISCSRNKGKNLDLNSKTIFGNIPLVLAIMNDNLKVMELLLEAGADPDRPETFERTALHIAAFFGRANVVDCYDQTPLSLSLMAKNSVSLVKHLLSAGADANFRSKTSMPILSLAVLSCTRYKELKNVNFLIRAGADVRATDNIKYDSALHKAAQTGYVKCIELLLKRGANVFAANIYGQTPLNVAIRYKNMEAALHLSEVEEEIQDAEFERLIANAKERNSF